jgi:hypothetical protein
MLGFATALLGLAFCRETGPAKSALTPILFSVLVTALPLIDAGVANTPPHTSASVASLRRPPPLLRPFAGSWLHGTPGGSGLLRDNRWPCDRGMVQPTVGTQRCSHLERIDWLRVIRSRSTDGRNVLARSFPREPDPRRLTMAQNGRSRATRKSLNRI